MRCTVARARRFDAAFKETSPTGKLTNKLAGVNFYYNLQNQLVFQKGTGTSNKHSQDAYYFWLGDIPVGVFNNQGAFNIYADHLNTPRQLFAWDDQWGQPTTRAKWQWSYSPFGANQPTMARNNFKEEHWDALNLGTVTRNTSAPDLVLDLRYPGQFYDASTGLHQNWMRMYDPQTARYTRADPIGLNGGMNRYAYVGGNALWAVDERGLDVTVVRNGKNVVVKSRIRIYGPYATSELAKRWQEIINSRWNAGNWNAGECKVTFEVEVGLDNKKWQNNIMVGPNRAAGSDLHSHVLMPIGMAGNSGTWYRDEIASNVAHEFGHIAGMSDKYRKRSDGYTEPLPGWAGNMMGDSGKVEQRNIDEIIEKYMSNWSKTRCGC